MWVSSFVLFVYMYVYVCMYYVVSRRHWYLFISLFSEIPGLHHYGVWIGREWLELSSGPGPGTTTITCFNTNRREEII